MVGGVSALGRVVIGNPHVIIARGLAHCSGPVLPSSSRSRIRIISIISSINISISISHINIISRSNRKSGKSKSFQHQWLSSQTMAVATNTMSSSTSTHHDPNQYSLAQKAGSDQWLIALNHPTEPPPRDSAPAPVPVDTNAETDADATIPETVLQYERQKRKMQAANRARQDTPLSNPLQVVYTDESIVVTNKPSGLLCVPGIHNHHTSLLHLVHTQFVSSDSMLERDQRIVHRLDMDTSGLVLFARSEPALLTLQKAFRDKQVGKTYEALVCGHMPSDFPDGPVEIDLPLQRDHRFPPFMRVATPDSELDVARAVQDLQHAGYKKLMRKKPKPSQTLLTIMGREYMSFGAGTKSNSKEYPVTRVSLTPLTGRTHQLRVHCAALGHPIVADPAYGIYGEASPNGGLELNDTCPGASLELQKEINASVDESSQCMCLHAKELSIIHPLTGNEMKFEAPVPF